MRITSSMRIILYVVEPGPVHLKLLALNPSGYSSYRLVYRASREDKTKGSARSLFSLFTKILHTSEKWHTRWPTRHPVGLQGIDQSMNCRSNNMIGLRYLMLSPVMVIINKFGYKRIKTTFVNILSCPYTVWTRNG